MGYSVLAMLGGFLMGVVIVLMQDDAPVGGGLAVARMGFLFVAVVVAVAGVLGSYLEKRRRHRS